MSVSSPLLSITVLKLALLSYSGAGLNDDAAKVISVEKAVNAAPTARVVRCLHVNMIDIYRGEQNDSTLIANICVAADVVEKGN